MAYSLGINILTGDSVVALALDHPIRSQHLSSIQSIPRCKLSSLLCATRWSPSEDMRGVQPPSWFPLISPCLFSSAPFHLLSIICMIACLTTPTSWAIISVTEARTLGHCALLSLQHCQSVTQEKYYYLPSTFLLSRGQHPWYVYETGPVDSNIVFLQTSLQLTIPFFTSKLFIPSEWKWKSLSCIPWMDTTPWMIQSVEFFRPEYWSGYPLQYFFSRGSSQPRDRTQASCIAGRFFTSWVTREALPSENLL